MGGGGRFSAPEICPRAIDPVPHTLFYNAIRRDARITLADGFRLFAKNAYKCQKVTVAQTSENPKNSLELLRCFFTIGANVRTVIVKRVAGHLRF